MAQSIWFSGLAVGRMCGSWIQKIAGQLLPLPPKSPVHPTTTRKRKRNPTLETPSPVVEKKRGEGNAGEDAKVRDDYKCRITGRQNTVDGAHVYSSYLIQKDPSAEVRGYNGHLWRVLGMFFEGPMVQQWKSELFDEEGPRADTCRNVLTLSKEVHDGWNDGYFVLKPSAPSLDGRAMEIYYQEEGEINVPLTTSPPQTPLTFNNWELTYQSRPPGEPVWLVKSEDRILFKTEDPGNYPLTSYQLLEMQWYLTRINRSAGGAQHTESAGDEE
ncbi:hypothetical protein F5884DRAFT_836500 [Xylogone sp. PMI_703]|nr:hypothetical protein F5884DRAFT_836500 [Xylogone sp. PMI_703]